MANGKARRTTPKPARAGKGKSSTGKGKRLY